MNPLKPLRNKLVSSLIRIRSARERNRLRAESNPNALPLSKSIDYALGNNLTDEELSWMEKIEDRRKELLASDERIEIEDFGAVSSDQTLTREAMQKGRFITRTVGAMCAMASKPPFWTQLLFGIIREFKPATGIELGSCVGLSAAYQAAAMRLNGSGRFVTLEGSKSLASITTSTFATLGLQNAKCIQGPFHETLGRVVEQNAPIDYAFIDGHHDEAATLEYFNIIASAAGPKTCMIFDDIRWSAGMLRAWKRIAMDSNVSVAADLYSMGVVVFENKHRG